MINRLALVSLIAAAGCTSQLDSLESSASRFEGIYSIESHNENLDACVPGAEVAVNDKFAIAWFSDRAFPAGLQFLSCASPDECRALRASVDRREGFSAELDFLASRESGDALVGGTISTGFADGDTCRMAEVTDIEMTIDGDTLTIREQHTVAPDYASDNGSCNTNETSRHIEGLSCSQLDLVAARRIDSL